jgi:hypothetical protein
MDPISIATSLASFAAPKIAGWLGGDDAEKTAKEVTEVAKSVTGQSDGQSAAEVIKQDPEQARKFREALAEYELKMERERTKRLTQINQTMRAAYKEDGWKSGWRPFFGYSFGVAWIATFFGLLALLFYAASLGLDAAIKFAGQMPQVIAAMTPLFGMGLKVLGVAIRERSRDKRLAAGVVDPPAEGFMDKIGAIFKGKPGAGNG